MIIRSKGANDSETAVGDPCTFEAGPSSPLISMDNVASVNMYHTPIDGSYSHICCGLLSRSVPSLSTCIVLTVIEFRLSL